jgi:hypothetical protein
VFSQPPERVKRLVQEQQTLYLTLSQERAYCPQKPASLPRPPFFGKLLNSRDLRFLKRNFHLVNRIHSSLLLADRRPLSLPWSGETTSAPTRPCDSEPPRLAGERAQPARVGNKRPSRATPSCEESAFLFSWIFIAGKLVLLFEQFRFNTNVGLSCRLLLPILVYPSFPALPGSRITSRKSQSRDIRVRNSLSVV